MTITHGHFRLSPEQRRFKELLARYPRLHEYWDFSKRECRYQALADEMGVMSSGEHIMAGFFFAVWSGNSDNLVDLVGAAKILESEDTKLIADWLIDPFFP